MTKPVTIKCVLRPIELQLVGLRSCHQRGYYFQLWLRGSQFTGHKFEVSSGVCAYDPDDGLVQFFEGLATSCDGWKSIKYWESPRCGLSLASWIDMEVGRVALGVEIWHGKEEVERVAGRSLSNLEWLEMVKEAVEQKVLFVDANQLEGIAASVREFFRTLEEAEKVRGELKFVARLEVTEGDI